MSLPKGAEANTRGEKNHHASFSFFFPQYPRCILEASTYCSDPANLTLELRGIAGPTEWTFLHWLSTVDGLIRCSTNVKGVVHIIIKLVGICRILLTGRQDFSGLGEGRSVLFKRTESAHNSNDLVTMIR